MALRAVNVSCRLQASRDVLVHLTDSMEAVQHAADASKSKQVHPEDMTLPPQPPPANTGLKIFCSRVWGCLEH